MWFWLTAAALAGPVESTSERWGSGRFRLAITEEEAQRRVDEAVAASLQGFAFFVRPLAQRPLQRAGVFCRTLDSVLADGLWRLGCVEHGDERAAVPLDGTPTTYEREGVMITANLHDRDPLAVRFATGDGHRITTYRFAAERADLDFFVASPRLTTPLRWSLPYVREALSPAPP